MELCKKSYLEKHTQCTPYFLLENDASCKLITKLLHCKNYSTQNIVLRNGKKNSHDKVPHNYIGCPIQADYN